MAEAMFEYTPQHVGDLALKVGDKVEVFHKGDDGWWTGTLRGMRGNFPGESGVSSLFSPRNFCGKKLCLRFPQVSRVHLTWPRALVEWVTRVALGYDAVHANYIYCPLQLVAGLIVRGSTDNPPTHPLCHPLTNDVTPVSRLHCRTAFISFTRFHHPSCRRTICALVSLISH